MNTATPTAIRTEPERAIRCDCCSTTLAVIRNGCLVIRQKHHGEVHLTTIPLARLVDLLRERAA
jgi:hypothetical protein